MRFGGAGVVCFLIFIYVILAIKKSSLILQPRNPLGFPKGGSALLSAFTDPITISVTVC